MDRLKFSFSVLNTFLVNIRNSLEAILERRGKRFRIITKNGKREYFTMG